MVSYKQKTQHFHTIKDSFGISYLRNQTQGQFKMLPHSRSFSNEPTESNDNFKSFWRVFQAEGAAYFLSLKSK